MWGFESAWSLKYSMTICTNISTNMTIHSTKLDVLVYVLMQYFMYLNLCKYDVPHFVINTFRHMYNAEPKCIHICHNHTDHISTILCQIPIISRNLNITN